MSLLRKIILFLSMLFIAVVLIYLSLAPSYSYILQISVEEPRPSKWLEMRRDKVIAISNGKEPIFFDIAGEVFTTTISKVSLSTHDPKEGEFKKQGDFKVANGSFLGIVRLGSEERPITSDVTYTYIIDSGDDNSRLSEGNIQVQVKAVISHTSRGWTLVIAGIGLLASVLQVYQFFTQRREVAKAYEENDVLDKPKYEQKKSKEQRVIAESKRRYIVALLFACIFIASTTTLLIIYYKSFTPEGVSGGLNLTSAGLDLAFVLVAIVSAIGTISSAIIAWRKDRREARESELKIVQLERELVASREKPALPISEGNRK